MGVFATLFSLFQYKNLMFSLAKREVAARFRGSFLGLFWALLLPLFMLCIYGFVFGVVFQARWGVETGAKGEFAVILFAGLLLHGLLAEILVRSTGLLHANANFVKKVVFPLEILPLVVILSSLFQFFIGFLVLLLGISLVYGTLYPTLLLAPLVVLPLVILLLGVSWGLCAIGVYFRDIGHLMGVCITLLLFFSTIFYPAEKLPALLQPLVYLNPLSFIVDQLRAVTLLGQWPDWKGLLAYAGLALVIMVFGLSLFQRLRRGFADAL